MSQRTFVVIGSIMVAVAAAVRINNGLTYHPLQGYDAFGHFTYVWYLAETGRVPLATQGWSFFHPPLYYLAMLPFWKGLPSVDPMMRLHIGMVFMALLNLTHAGVAYLIVRRCFPGERLIHLLAVGLMLFIPVHLYGSAFLGNEGLGAVFCSLSILTLLATLARPSAARGAVLGLCLGLGMLTKFTALPIIVGGLAALGLQSLRRRTFGIGLRTVSACVLVILAVSGWYFARNISLYGNPFKLSRDEFMVQRVEHFQTKGNRTLLEYITFDPLILWEPQFPRGLPLAGEVPKDAKRGPIRESVWTGMYANSWFDGFGNWVLPAIDRNGGTRFAGRLLLSLGLVPTLIILFGMVTGATRSVRREWDDTIVAMLLITGAMVATFVQGTRVAPLHAAIKATYFMPITVVFSFWFALGLKVLSDRKRRCVSLVAFEGAVLAVAAVLVFTRGLIFETNHRGYGALAWENLEGMVYYAAGDRSTARRLFSSSARRRWHLALENLAALDFEEGKPQTALQYLEAAAQLERQQAFGIEEDAKYVIRMTQADYLNSKAVILHTMKSRGQALAAAKAAVNLGPDFAEPYYNIGVLTLFEALDGQEDGTNPERNRRLIREASRYLTTAVRLDPGLMPAVAALGVSQALAGDCDAAVPMLRQALDPPPGVRRAFPAETGTGDLHAAALGRRRLIESLPKELEPPYDVGPCKEAIPGRSS